MEESAQRKERLKAMRMEASQEATTYNEGSELSQLSNPLLEPAPHPEGQAQPHAQSFNYYTDPMAAFSGSNRRSKVSPQISQDFSSTPPSSMINESFLSPAPQPHLNHPRMQQQPQGRYENINYAYTSNAPQGGNFSSPNPNPNPNLHFNQTPGRGPGQGPGYPNPHFSNSPGHGPEPGYSSPSPGPRPRPHFVHTPRPGYASPGPRPYFNNSPGHGSGQGYPGPGPHFGNSPNHGPVRGYPSPVPNQGRGHWLGNNMGSESGSGRGRGYGGGRGRGRGGAHSHVSAEEQPDLFYNKSMVEDPWKFLEPVVWKSHKKPWLPNSLGIKKPRVSESPRQQQKQSSSQPSLAEILAASFNELADDDSKPSVG